MPSSKGHPLQLGALLDGHAHQVIYGDPDIPITSAPSVDIDRVAPGSLYLALPGHPDGGPEGIAAAFTRGAVAVLVQEPLTLDESETPPG